MCADPYAALERQRQREAAHRRRQQSQREDLRHAACLLIPDHGLSVSLAQLAIQAGLTRHTVAGLFHSVADLAVHLVCRTWRALIEATAPAPGSTAEDFCARLIEALRADAAAHRVWQAIHCGLPPRHRQTLAEAEAFLNLAIGEALHEICPALSGEPAELGGRLLALARHAAYAAAAADIRAEASIIAACLKLLGGRAAVATPAPPPASARPDGRAHRPRPNRLRTPLAAPPAALPPPIWNMPRPRGKDPPAAAG